MQDSLNPRLVRAKGQQAPEDTPREFLAVNKYLLVGQGQAGGNEAMLKR